MLKKNDLEMIIYFFAQLLPSYKVKHDTVVNHLAFEEVRGVRWVRWVWWVWWMRRRGIMVCDTYGGQKRGMAYRHARSGSTRSWRTLLKVDTSP